MNVASYWSSYIGSVICPGTLTVPINTVLSQLVTHQDFGIVTGMNIIRGNVFVDANSNCLKDISDPVVSGGTVTFSYGPHTASVQPNGSYSINVPVGTYSGTLHFNTPGNNAWDSVSCPSNNSIPFSFTGIMPDTITNQNFGLTAGTCPKLQTTIYTGNMRPCFYHHSNIYIHNLTAVTATNVVATVVLDPAEIPLTTGWWYNTPWTSILGNVITYNIGNINGYGSYNITIWDSTRCDVVIGDTLHISAFANYTPTLCVDSSYSYAIISHITTASCDPNSKETTFPFGENITANDYLNYTINFQNTGTDTAFNITVIDTLPPELDPLTLIPAGGSSAYTYQLIGNNIAKFIFHNVQLPDSTASEVNSHGFVNFTINQVAGHLPGTIIRNHAAIYFDFNLPVITNSTFNIIPQSAVGIKESVISNDEITVYPNPFTNDTRFIFKDSGPNSKYTISLFDVTGKKVREINSITEKFYDLNKGDLKPQIYFYKVWNNQMQVGVGKLVIME